MKSFRYLGLLLSIMLIVPTAFTLTKCSKQPVNTKASSSRWHCPMHPDYIKNAPGSCPLCGMNLVPISSDANAQDNGISIDPSITKGMGMRMEVVQMRSLSQPIHAGAVAAADEASIRTVSIKTNGWIEKIDASRSGVMISQGAPLFSVYSPELIAAEEEYLSSIAYAEKLESSSASPKAIETAHDLAGSTRRKLSWLDLTDEHLDRLLKTRNIERLIEVRSPADGLILEKTINTGSRIEKGSLLYRIADISGIWVEALIYAADAGRAAVGSKADVSFPALPGKTFSGTVVSLDPQADPSNRSIGARIKISNTKDMAIRPGMAATVIIYPSDRAPCLSVSSDAVIRTGERTLVIRALGQGRFAPAPVETGSSDAEFVEIVSGLSDGDSIVSSGQFLIDSESRLRSALAAFDTIAAADDRPNVLVTVEPPLNPVPMPKNAGVWICPMDPQIISDHKVSCPICGMDLELKKD